MHLTEPEPLLVNYLSGAAGLMGSPDALGTEEMKTNPVGSGPYTLDPAATSVGSQYAYVKNEDYWGPELQHYDKIVIQVIGDPTARVNALVSGQVDAAPVPQKSMEQAEEAGLVPHLQDLDFFGLTLIDRGGELSPALADVRVRQAINYALDKETILKELYLGQGTPTSQVFSTESTAYIEDLDEAYPYDPAKAKELLAEAGFDDVSFEVALVATEDPALKAVLQEQLAAVGITLEVKELAPADAWDLITPAHSAFIYSLKADSTWGAINQYLAPDGAVNPFHSDDPKLAALIEEIQYGDEATAAAKAKELNEYVVEQAWFAPLFRLTEAYYSNDKVDVEVQLEQGISSIYNFKPAE